MLIPSVPEASQYLHPKKQVSAPHVTPTLNVSEKDSFLSSSLSYFSFALKATDSMVARVSQQKRQDGEERPLPAFPTLTLLGSMKACVVFLIRTMCTQYGLLTTKAFADRSIGSVYQGGKTSVKRKPWSLYPYVWQILFLLLTKKIAVLA